MLRSNVVALFALCSLGLFATGCGGGTETPAVDAGPDRQPVIGCLDQDGDGVPGTGDCKAISPVDCDDTDPTVFPGATEACNGHDDDCNDQVDEGLPVVSYFRDTDGDGFGGDPTGEGCASPEFGFSAEAGDCDDLNKDIHPGVTEICDGVDQDCDGNTDDGLVFRNFGPDVDGDGFGDAAATPENSCAQSLTGKVPNLGDCNDQSALVHPGANELCNKQDDNCDGQLDNGITFVDYYPDVDGDGYGAASGVPENSCSAVPGKVINHTDCNDQSALVKPGAPEECNGVDDNCNGPSDEGLTFALYYLDSDGDGFGASTGTPISACKPQAGRINNAQDCDDGNPGVKPTAAELCNGVDDNCNGQTDDGLSFQNYYVDADGDGYGAANGTAQNSCTPLMGRVANKQDCNDGSATVKPGATESCNGVDDNCAGGVDEGFTFSTWYVDADGDGFGATGTTGISSCQPVSGRVANNTDCDDTRAQAKPGATETCNGKDDNCAGGIDEGLPTTSYYTDSDGDGYGSSSVAAQVACAPVAGKATNNTDCNDNANTVRPGAPETCNGVDDNCDGSVDNGTVTLNYYVDADNDGYGATTSGAQASCTPIAGKVTNNTDCNDGSSAVHPGATELCNGINDNCAGGTDEGLTFLSYYPDIDSDGFGASGATAQSDCKPVPGKVTSNTDCNDNNLSVKPGATELCNGVDDNCAGGVDEGLTFTPYYPDADSDGYGSAAASPTSACSVPPGKVTNKLDCNDGSASVKPGGTEVCNNQDDNCNGSVDEGNAGGGGNCVTGQPGVCSAGTLTCQGGALTCLQNVPAGGVEKCNGLDDDCDNQVDETFTNKGAACSAGLGVCKNNGTFVCAADGGTTLCSATPGNPTAAACGDLLDNDCDGIVDEPAFTNTVDLATSIDWQDIEVAPYHYSASGCSGGADGSGTDVLAGGALAMGGGVSGLLFQKLTTTGALSGTPTSIVGLKYSDVALAQAGDGFLVAGVYADKELDLYYVAQGTGLERARKWSLFNSTNKLDSLRVVRGNGKRVTLIWREAGVGIKYARVEPFLDSATSTWAIKTPAGSTTITASVLVANTAVLPGVGADDNHQDWITTQTCPATATLAKVGVSYVKPSGTSQVLSHFTVNEDGTSKSAEEVVETRAAGYTLTEPETVFYRSGSADQYLVAWVTGYVSSAQSDLNYWMTTHKVAEYAWLALADENGVDSIRRPRASATATGLTLTALRYVSDPGGYRRQVMSRQLDLVGAKSPTASTVEVPVTVGTCAAGDTACRPGDKSALACWAAKSKCFYSGADSAPLGAFASTLTCQ